MDMTRKQILPIFEPEHRQFQKATLLTAVLLREVPVHTAAKVVGVDRSTAYRWLRLYQRGREWDLLDRRYGPDSLMHGIRKRRERKDDEPCPC